MRTDIIKKNADQIEKLIKDNQETKERLQQKLAEAEELHSQLEAAISDAIQRMNAEEHHKLSDENRRVCDDIAMYRAKLESLERDPMMTKEAYQETLDAIITYRDNRIKSLRKRAGAHLKDIQEMYDKERALFEEANAALADLRKTVMRETRVFIEMDDTGTLGDLGYILSRESTKRLISD